MTVNSEPIVGYLVHATRREGASKVRVRQYMVGIGDREEAAAAVISAHPDLDDGYHVEADLGVILSEATKWGLAYGEIRFGSEEAY